ncbi:hypothetical protein GCM10010123_18980 [Pilimelia anulata]|uniref:Secreted protein n=1 Tax=Pilimelia anulata TaxID=53371 RepID=A0A8J3F8I9_9ACTN|nr:hypothetical protein [Pilimelia anulata]GGJ89531.1 hypothetical protein GCM10010123_18980 [Pilimelia anulata]
MRVLAALLVLLSTFVPATPAGARPPAAATDCRPGEGNSGRILAVTATPGDRVIHARGWVRYCRASPADPTGLWHLAFVSHGRTDGRAHGHVGYSPSYTEGVRMTRDFSGPYMMAWPGMQQVCLHAHTVALDCWSVRDDGTLDHPAPAVIGPSSYRGRIPDDTRPPIVACGTCW